jgi:Putative prokaryotic signal transducing protein
VEAAEPVEVYSTNDPNEAEIIRAALDGEGIPSQVTGENQAGLAGLDMVPITIVVRASDYDRARAFIEDHQRESEDENEEEDQGE